MYIGINEDEDVLEYFGSGDQPLWTVPVKDIVLLAEYTTNGGYWGDDSYLMFASVERGDFYFSSVITESAGIYMLLKRLAERWKTDLQLESGGPTLWSSRILWPPELAGQEYFEFREVQPRTLLEWRRKAALGPAREYSPCETVRDFLRSHSER